MFQPFEDLWSSPNLSIFLAIGCLWTTWPTNQFVELVFWTICAHRKTWQVLRRSSCGKWKQKSKFILSCFLKKYVSDPKGVEVKEREPEKEDGTHILHMSNWYCGGQKKRSKETHAHWDWLGWAIWKHWCWVNLCTPRKGASSCAFCWGFHIKKTPPIGRKACALDGIKKHSTPFEQSCLMFQCSPQGQPPEPMWFHRSFRYHLDSFKQVQDSNKILIIWDYMRLSWHLKLVCFEVAKLEPLVRSAIGVQLSRCTALWAPGPMSGNNGIIGMDRALENLERNVLSVPTQASNIIKYHQISSNIIKYHQISSNIIKYHQISSNIIKYHQISSNIIKKSSNIIKYHQKIIKYHQT